MLRSSVAVATILAALTLAVPTFAGIADSPVPPPFTKHLYSVSGVVNGGGLGTFFSCTSALEAGPVTVGIEAFGAGGGTPLNNAATTAVTLSPGGTVTFGTLAPAGLQIDVNLALPALVSNGSARILSTSKSLICTAYAAATGSSPPVTSWYLTIVAKLKQKAAN